MSDGLDSEAGRMMRKIDSIRQALGIKNDKSFLLLNRFGYFKIK